MGPDADVELGAGEHPGVRVLNLAGVGQSGWDIIEDSIDEEQQSMVWSLDTTEGKVSPSSGTRPGRYF